MITDVATFFTDGCGRCPRFATDACSARLWTGGIAQLRQMCLKAGLMETLRWGHPCNVHAGRNLVLLGAFRDDFRMTFPDAALLNDPKGVLERPGPNSQTACMIRFRALDDVARLAPVIADLLAQARAQAAAGNRPPRTRPDPSLPEVLVRALDDDPALADSFAALTPGRQRSYGIALSSAKTEATQIARIARFSDRIHAGKGANER